MPAITVGTDFRGNTSSAVARLPLAGQVGGVFSGILEATSSIVAPVSVFFKGNGGLRSIQILMAKTAFQDIQ